MQTDAAHGIDGLMVPESRFLESFTSSASCGSSQLAEVLDSCPVLSYLTPTCSSYLGIQDPTVLLLLAGVGEESGSQ